MMILSGVSDASSSTPRAAMPVFVWSNAPLRICRTPAPASFFQVPVTITSVESKPLSPVTAGTTASNPAIEAESATTCTETGPSIRRVATERSVRSIGTVPVALSTFFFPSAPPSVNWAFLSAYVPVSNSGGSSCLPTVIESTEAANVISG